MGFGYKTAWLAAPTASPEAVADALDLRRRTSLPWREGTGAAYEQGVFIARPVPGWTLAHGRTHLIDELEAPGPRFPDWLRHLSDQLGEVQFFLNDRSSGHFSWARAVAGEITRAYYYGDMTVFRDLGAPTDIEREFGAATPYEQHVMRVARSWSISPDDIPDDSVTASGIYGFPPGVEPRP